MVWSSAIRNPTVAMASGQKQSANVDLFDAYFRQADLDRDDQISGNEAVAFFQGSDLPKQAFNNSNPCLVLVLGTWQPQLEEGHRSQLLLLILRKISRPSSRNLEYQNWRNIL
nr:uncharacterized protein LOC103452197 isoform X2 [Malus domestica]